MVSVLEQRHMVNKQSSACSLARKADKRERLHEIAKFAIFAVTILDPEY